MDFLRSWFEKEVGNYPTFTENPFRALLAWILHIVHFTILCINHPPLRDLLTEKWFTFLCYASLLFDALVERVVLKVSHDLGNVHMRLITSPLLIPNLFRCWMMASKLLTYKNSQIWIFHIETLVHYFLWTKTSQICSSTKSWFYQTYGSLNLLFLEVKVSPWNFVLVRFHQL